MKVMQNYVLTTIPIQTLILRDQRRVRLDRDFYLRRHLSSTSPSFWLVLSAQLEPHLDRTRDCPRRCMPFSIYLPLTRHIPVICKPSRGVPRSLSLLKR